MGENKNAHIKKWRITKKGEKVYQFVYMLYELIYMKSLVEIKTNML